MEYTNVLTVYTVAINDATSKNIRIAPILIRKVSPPHNGWTMTAEVVIVDVVVADPKR